MSGVFAFHHGHSHGGGGSHNHSHSTHEEEPLSIVIANGTGDHGHQHSHHGGAGHNHSHDGGSHNHSHHGGSGHNHSHGGGGEKMGSIIMQGVFLHILADALGSVGVIISAVLMHMFGWMIADPICSMFIAIMIALSVMGLIKESVGILMQRQPRELDPLLPKCYQQLARLEGVRSVQVNEILLKYCYTC